jgi:hypothetical protein
MKSAALPVTIGLSARARMMALLQILGRDPRVRDDHFIDMSALDLLDRFFLLAVLLGFVVLLAILMQAMVSLDRLAFRLLHLGSAVLELLDEALVRLLTMLAFGVFLRTRLPLFSIRHPFESPVRERSPPSEAQAKGQRLPPGSGSG